MSPGRGGRRGGRGGPGREGCGGHQGEGRPPRGPWPGGGEGECRRASLRVAWQPKTNTHPQHSVVSVCQPPAVPSLGSRG